MIKPRIMPEKLKPVCNDCGEDKQVNFSRNKKTKTGFQPLCKKCFKLKYYSGNKIRSMYDGVTCKVDDCHNDAVIKGMCRRHYKMLYDRGTFDAPKKRKQKPAPSAIVPTDGIPWGVIKGVSLEELYER